MKKLSLIFIFSMQYLFVFSQTIKYINTDVFVDVDSIAIYGTTTNDNIFVIGIYHFDTLVFAVPNIRCFDDITNIKYKEIAIEKHNLKNLFLYEKNIDEDFNFLIFSSIGYILLTTNSSLIWDFIVPNISNEYVEMIKTTYPKQHSIFTIQTQAEEEYNCYKIREIKHKKFLVLLMKLSFYNTIRTKINPHNFIFKNNKYEQGLYIKVLIPLKDE